jgi:hypothetical protein
MPKMITPLLVFLEMREKPHEVSSDQRDLAAWEAHNDYKPAAVHLQARFVAWSALRRNGLYTDSWRTFNEVDCIEVESLATADDQGDEQGLDPGGRSTAGTTSSSW